MKLFGGRSKPRDEDNAEAWHRDVFTLIKAKGPIQTVHNNILSLMRDKGVCDSYRAEVWAFLIGNQLKINRQLFYIIFNKAVQTFSSDSLIKKDIDRTFFYFSRNETFTKVLAEASILLQMFTVR